MQEAIQETIKRVAERADFHELFDCFADNVEFKVAIEAVRPVCDTLRGKQTVIDYLQRNDEVDARPADRPIDFVVSDERVVAACEEAYLTINSGLAVRSECVLVFDVHDGLITRLEIHHELFPSVHLDRRHFGS